MRKLLLIALLMGLVSAAEYSVQFDPFQINVTNGGTFQFEINKSLHYVSFSAGPDSQLNTRELTGVSRPPPEMIVYRLIEVKQVNSISNYVLKFAIAKNWLNNQDSNIGEVVVKLRVDGVWEDQNAYREGGDMFRYIVRVRPKEIGVFAIGISTAEEVEETPVQDDVTDIVCAKPTEWSECIGIEKTRIVEELIGGECIEKTEVDVCPIQLGMSWNSWVPGVTVVAMLLITSVLVYSIVTSNKVF